MTPDLAALVSAAQSPEWSSSGLERIRSRFIFSSTRSSSCAVATVEVERSKADLAQCAAQCAALFGESAKQIVVSAAIAGAISSILDDVHRTLKHALSQGQSMRQSSETRFVTFQAEHESFVALLLQTFADAAHGTLKGQSGAAQAAACFKCGQHLTHSLCSLLSATELDENIALGADRFFAHLSNLARMSIISRELFSEGSPGQASTESIVAHLGIS
ncbi:MAG: hypothetical protein U0136_12610 [Bdellovibrionota bacterium]